MRTISLAVVSLLLLAAPVEARRKLVLPGQRAVVIDERYSALRDQPELQGPLTQRLRRGRAVGILGASRNRRGERFYRVAVSRNTRGWVFEAAIARPGNSRDAERLLNLIEETPDDYIKARLAKICAEAFRYTPAAPRAWLILGDAGTRAAEKLTREARRRLGEHSVQHRRAYFLNYIGLDRFNRLGIFFDYDEARDCLLYDGAAFRTLARRYPRSEEARRLASEPGRSSRSDNR